MSVRTYNCKYKYILLILSDYFRFPLQCLRCWNSMRVPLNTYCIYMPVDLLQLFFLNFVALQASDLISERAKVHISH